VSTVTVALIFSSKSIAFAIGAMVCAWALDQFAETHRYIACVMVLQSTAVVLLPFTSNLPLAFSLFIVIGFSMGSVFVCFPVYVFRLYPHRKSKMLSLYLLLSIYLPAKIMTPLLIQFAISSFNAYDLPLFLISALSFISGISMLSVSTPQHDDLRTIKDDIQIHDDHPQRPSQCPNVPAPIVTRNGYHLNHEHFAGATATECGHNISDDRTDPDRHSEPLEDHGLSISATDLEASPRRDSRRSNGGSVLPQIMDSVHGVHQSEMYLESPTEIEDISNQISFLLRNDHDHVRFQNAVIAAIATLYLLFSSTQSALTTFITTFCEDHLNADESNGRFMISCYYSGQFSYRLAIILLVGTGKCALWIRPNVTLIVSFVMTAVVALMFVVLQRNLLAVYVVYSLSGIVGGGIIPDLYGWSESVRPLSGVVSCIHIIAFSGGDALSNFVVGELFGLIGPQILPLAVLIVNVLGFVVVIAGVVLFSKYKQHRSQILGHYYNRC